MDVNSEACDASKNEVEVGGGLAISELETLDERPQKAAELFNCEKDECGLTSKHTLSESSLSNVSFSSAKSSGSLEDNYEATPHGDMEGLSNGVSSENEYDGPHSSENIGSEDIPNDDTVLCDTLEFSKFHESNNGDDRSDEDEANFEVSELINEILHQSSYLDDGGLNGLDFVDSLPDGLDNGTDELDGCSANIVLPIYQSRKDERPSSPDSDSTMTTASEGSSSLTSQLSASSLQNNHVGLQNFIQSDSREFLNQLINSPELSQIEFKAEISPLKDTDSDNFNLGLENLEVVSLTVPNSTIEKLKALDPINGLGILEISSDSGVADAPENTSSIDISFNDTSKIHTENIDSTFITNCSNASTKEIVGSINENNYFEEEKNRIIDRIGNALMNGNLLPDHRGILIDGATEGSDLCSKSNSDIIEELSDLNMSNSPLRDDPKFINEIGETLAALETLSLDTNVDEAFGVKHNCLDDNILNSVKPSICDTGGENYSSDLGLNTFEKLDLNSSAIDLSTPEKCNELGISSEVKSEVVEPLLKPELGNDNNVETKLNAINDQNAFQSDLLLVENNGQKQNEEKNVANISTVDVKCKKEMPVMSAESQKTYLPMPEKTNDECNLKKTELNSSPKCVSTGESNLQVVSGGKSQNHDCNCKRAEVSEDSGSVIVGVWNELRSSIRQLHRSLIPQSTPGSSHRSRPSINRIKALANMLMSHDAHQLYLRILHLAHELCIELKVRLLSSINDDPSPEDAAAFIQGVCDSYQWVMSVCEALHPALERLDSEHLSRFKLNWVTLNMHIFHASILTEPDVQDYTNICKEKLKSSNTGEEVIRCLVSLHRTLSVAETVWLRADTLLQDYAVERAALARRRQFWYDMGMKNHHANHAAHQSVKNGEEGSNQCPCNDCIGVRGGSVNLSTVANGKIARSSLVDMRPPSSCECHFCNASIGPPVSSSEEPVITTSSGNSLPPLAQPQLSLYPHIHNTPPGSDIVGTGQSREDGGSAPPPPTTKPPITTNPYLGSDLLTEQLMREWELVYGDTLTPPGSHPILPPDGTILPHFQGDPSGLVSGVETLHLNTSRPSYTRTMIDPSLPYVPDSRVIARAQTTVFPSSSSQSTTVATSHPMSSASGPIVPSSSSVKHTTPTMNDTNCSKSMAEVSSAVKCCSATNTTSVITHTSAHHTHTTAPLPKNTINGFDEPRKHPVDQLDQSSRESLVESETSGRDEWSSGDESDSSATVSSSHRDPHCDCCYCHMLHHKQDGGRQKYSDRRDRLLQILNRKKKARSMSGSNTCTASAPLPTPGVPTPSPSVQTSKSGTVPPLGGQNINKILDFIEGNQIDEAKLAKKAAKKARQKQKKLATIRRREEEEDDEDEEYEEEEFDDAQDDDCCGDDINDEDDDDCEEDGPLAELRRRAPDVTITVVRPGQQAPRTASSPQTSFGKPREPSPPSIEAYKSQAKMVPSLVQNQPEAKPPPTASRTILQPSRPSQQTPPNISQRGRLERVPNTPLVPGMSSSKDVTNKAEPPAEGNPSSASAPTYTGLSSILKGMENLNNKDKEKGSQMVTIRRVMDPNNAEPTVTITLKGDEPEKDKVLFKLVNGQAVAGQGKKGKGKGGGGNGNGGGSGGSGSNQEVKIIRQPRKEPSPPIDEPPIPEGLNPEEVKVYKKKMKKERQRQKKLQEQKDEEDKGRLQQLELQKQQELLRQQQEQIRQKQLALQRQEEELIKQQQNPKASKNKKKKKKDTPTSVSSSSSSSISNNNSNSNSKNKNKSSVSEVSAVVYDADDMAHSYNLPPGVTINKVAGQPGMVTISNNMGGAFSQPYLPNPNVYSSPLVQGGYPGKLMNQGSSLSTSSSSSSIAKSCSVGQNSGLSWNSAIDTDYPDKDNVIVVDTNNGYHGVDPTSSDNKQQPVSSEEKILMAVKGLIDPSTLNMTQKKKYKKMKKVLAVEQEKADLKQKEEDALMDQVYNIVKGKGSSKGGQGTQQQQQQQSQQQQQVKNQGKKNQKQKENVKENSAVSNTSKPVTQSTKGTKQLQKTNEKQKQDVSRQNSKNNSKQSVDNSLQNITNQPRKNSCSSQQSNGKQSQSQTKQPTQKQSQQQKQQSQQQQQQKVQTQQKKQSQKLQQPQQQTQIKQSQPKSNSQQKNKQPQQKQVQSQQKQQVQQNQQQGKQVLNQSQLSSHQKKQQNNGGNSIKATNNSAGYSGPIGFGSEDIAHEARYAQYLAANASTLSKLSCAPYKNTSGGSDCVQDHCDEDKTSSKKKKSRKGKKGHLEDMTTIDSVFTPKDIVEGELDETERDVEAFKRFCFNNVPRHSGEKPKVNFNVKDIMIKKRPCNVNL